MDSMEEEERHLLEAEMDRNESSSSSLLTTSSMSSSSSSSSPNTPLLASQNATEEQLDSPSDSQSVMECGGRCISTQAMQSLYDLCQNNLLCDAAIRLEDGGVFPIHRAILSTCSTYFRTLFTTILYSQDKSDLFIPGVSSDVMNLLLRYAYLRSIRITYENVCQIFIAANYLCMFGVLDICRNYLRDHMTPENCIGVLRFSRDHYCQGLQGDAHDYIMRNFVEIILRSEEIINLPINELCQLLDADELNVKTEEIVWEFIVKWIDHDPDNRKQYITQLLSTVRLGLLDMQYFYEKIKEHKYIAGVEVCRPIIIETLKFLYDLEMIAQKPQELATPKIARPRIPHEILFIFGGWIGNNATSLIETYNTRADCWIPQLDIDASGGERAYHAAATIGFNIYVIGGYNGIEYFSSCRCFNAVTKTWREVAPMNSRRCYVALAVLDDIIYAMGGFDGLLRLKTAEKYDYRTNQWSLIAPMNVQRSEGTAAAFNNKIYIFGGFNGFECTNTVEVYDPKTDQWTMLASMECKRGGSSCIAYQNSVFVFGGFNGISRMKSCERYNPTTNTWTYIRSMYYSRSNFAVEVIDDLIFVIGGYNGIISTFHVECYDINTNEWYAATDLNIYRCGHSACVIMGLPNAHDYIYQQRDHLMGEKRKKLLALELQRNYQSPESNQQQNQRNQLTQQFLNNITVNLNNTPTNSASTSMALARIGHHH